MQPFKHILVGTDFGEPAERAAELAIELAKKFDAKLTLVHAYSLPVAMYAAELNWPIDDFRQAAEKTLRAAAAKIEARYPPTEHVLVLGGAPEQILTAAKERGADLIVVGTHGRRGLSRALMGSVAERVVRLSPVPVLTVGGGEQAR